MFEQFVRELGYSSQWNSLTRYEGTIISCHDHKFIIDSKRPFRTGASTLGFSPVRDIIIERWMKL